MNWISVAEISKITGIPAPTARRYASLFKDFLPSRKMGRVTKYPDSVIAIFQRIVTLYNDGLVTTEIEEKLKSEYPRTIEVSPNERSVSVQPAVAGQLELGEAFSGLMERMSKSLEVIADQKEIIEDQRCDIAKLKRAFILLARSQKKMKELPQLDYKAMTEEFEGRTEALRQKDSELEEATSDLAQENSTLRRKLEVMETELIRLRRDRREMEKYFLDKIKKIQS
ncbi:MerR family transcriptional regulator [Maridesulfovibrio bastinii]|jgi:DNA-binding transcriptional MerR regulator|uniref:MerR family transcriptional regulator n=1 Tax=Maridesulfovibrio bastinii TaxID=47157 RepID=UPI00040E9A36|nr:MerR family transcriptional regulator [Maridesulfovibrio bastinii]